MSLFLNDSSQLRMESHHENHFCINGKLFFRREHSNTGIYPDEYKLDIFYKPVTVIQIPDEGYLFVKSLFEQRLNKASFYVETSQHILLATTALTDLLVDYLRHTVDTRLGTTDAVYNVVDTKAFQVYLKHYYGVAQEYVTYIHYTQCTILVFDARTFVEKPITGTWLV